MYDVIYFEEERETYDQIKAEIKKEFPAAIVEDASDEIHGCRMSVTDDEESREGIWRLLLRASWPHSLGIQMACRSDDEHYELLKRLVDEIKPSARNEKEDT